MSNPLSVQCDQHHASIGVPCQPNGSTCAARAEKADTALRGKNPVVALFRGLAAQFGVGGSDGDGDPC